MPFFSIVIPTLNEEKFLPLLLTDLKNQTEQDFEVIHVDGDSEDKTVQVAQSYKDFFPIRSRQTEVRNVCVQRNLGGSIATGSWVLFMDADNRLDTDFFKTLKDAITNKPTCTFFTCLLDEHRIAREGGIPFLLTSLLNLWIIVNSYSYPFVIGNCIGVKKELLETIQFNPALTQAEDHDFAYQAKKLGHRITVFSKPRYFSSTRRVKAEGTIWLLTYSFKAIIQHLSRRKLFSTIEHPMLGGKTYQDVDSTEQ